MRCCSPSSATTWVLAAITASPISRTFWASTCRPATTRLGAVLGQRAGAGARRLRHLGASSASKYGKLLIAVRDAESRTRFLGWRAENVKLFAFTVSAVMAGIAGALYVPQVGIINPGEFEPAQLDRGGHLDGGRRPRHHRRADRRRGAGQHRQSLVHRRAAGILAVCARRRCSSPSRCSCPRASSACGTSWTSARRERAGRRDARRSSPSSP